MKIKVTLLIDEKIKKKAMYLIQNVLKSSLSKEVEDYLNKLVEGFEVGKRK